jgi:hypothetical protein
MKKQVTETVKCLQNSKIIYASENEFVEVLEIRGKVAIVKNAKNVKFSIQTKKLK